MSPLGGWSGKKLMVFGNRFAIATLLEDIRGNELGIRFSSPKTGIVSEISLIFGFGLEDCYPSKPPIVRVGLQDDNGKGQPTDMFLSYHDETVDPIDYGGGWHKIAIPSVQVVAGKTYHIVVKKIESNCALCLDGLVTFTTMRPYYYGHNERCFYIPQTQTVDPLLTLERKDPQYKNEWLTFAQTPSFLVKFDDGTYYGQPYVSSHEHYVYGSSQVGQEFTGNGGVFNKLALWLMSSKQQPLDSLYASILCLDTQKYLLEKAKVANLKVPQYQWGTCYFPSLQLEQGLTYRLELKSPLSTLDKSWLLRSMYSYVAEGTYAYGGCYSMDGGKTWSKSFFADGKKTITDFPFILFE